MTVPNNCLICGISVKFWKVINLLFRTLAMVIGKTAILVVYGTGESSDV